MSFDVFAAALRAPHAIAVVDGERELTYAELAARSAGVAERLAARELLVQGSPLALIARPTLATLAALLACFAHGVPVLLLHPRQPAADRDELAARAGARGAFDPDAEAEASLSGIIGARAPIDPASPLAIVPTSGTTGKPKLVVLSRAAFEASARASATNLRLDASDRWFLCLSPSHVGGLSIVTRCLLARSAVCVFQPSPSGLLERASELASALVRSRATLVSLVPTLLGALLDLPDFRAPETLRAVLLGGASTSPELLERASARGLSLLVTYGLTESCSQVTTTPFGTRPRTRDGLVSSGRPLPGFELRVLDDHRIAVRGPTLAQGLLDDALPRDEEGFLVTDDLGRLDADGELFVYGRASDRIVSGGENVDPVRVESALLREPGVRAACVFAVADARFGEIVACALVVSADFDPARCARRLERELAPEARPRRAALLEHLPELPNGKLDRESARLLSRAGLVPWSALGPRVVPS